VSSVALEGFAPQSAQASSLRQALARSGVALKPAGQAELTLVAETEQRERTVLAASASGLVRELELRVRLRYSVLDARGREGVPNQELLQTRTLTYQERDALAKEQEQEGLYKAMHDDITAQVMRRLAARRAPL
jgi:LPS-assembly lipoprotein